MHLFLTWMFGFDGPEGIPFDPYIQMLPLAGGSTPVAPMATPFKQKLICKGRPIKKHESMSRDCGYP